MVNIGNNIFDNLKQMRRPYVAPEMLVEEIMEENILQAISNGNEVEHQDGELGQGAKVNNVDPFFWDDPIDYSDDDFDSENE